MANEIVNGQITDAVTQTNHPEAPYGWCPVCGEKGVMRERRPDGDVMCRRGHKYPSRDALRNQPDYTTTSNATQPCKSCGKDNAVREFGLMCEDCQRESKFTVSGKQLTEHLIKAQEQDMAQRDRLKAENDRAFERNAAAQKAHQEEHWRLIREHQAEIDKQNIEQMNERERLADERMIRSNEFADKRTRDDQLHRIYTMLLGKEADLVGNPLTPLGYQRLMDRAHEYQLVFERITKETAR